MRFDKYDIKADGNQFILNEVKINDTVKDGVKSKNFGNEQLVSPSYHTSWEGVLRKLSKLELMASVSEFDTIEGVVDDFMNNMSRLEGEAKKVLGR